ncbi:hypothetical protein [Herminiimonas sp. CN]|uniref:hypothetical protein n=1 Tax=Herminiimonas sp. CN TaxID=1349818 RepID=UPI0012DD21BD|nr:hypothetical protein [Herminiimonas sp. CN]
MTSGIWGGIDKASVQLHNLRRTRVMVAEKVACSMLCQRAHLTDISCSGSTCLATNVVIDYKASSNGEVRAMVLTACRSARLKPVSAGNKIAMIFLSSRVIIQRPRFPILRSFFFQIHKVVGATNYC